MTNLVDAERKFLDERERLLWYFSEGQELEPKAGEAEKGMPGCKSRSEMMNGGRNHSRVKRVVIDRLIHSKVWYRLKISLLLELTSSFSPNPSRAT